MKVIKINKDNYPGKNPLKLLVAVYIDSEETFEKIKRHKDLISIREVNLESGSEEVLMNEFNMFTSKNCALKFVGIDFDKMRPELY